MEHTSTILFIEVGIATEVLKLLLPLPWPAETTTTTSATFQNCKTSTHYSAIAIFHHKALLRHYLRKRTDIHCFLISFRESYCLSI